MLSDKDTVGWDEKYNFVASDVLVGEADVVILNGHENCNEISHKEGMHKAVVLIFKDGLGGYQMITMPVEADLVKRILQGEIKQMVEMIINP